MGYSCHALENKSFRLWLSGLLKGFTVLVFHALLEILLILIQSLLIILEDFVYLGSRSHLEQIPACPYIGRIARYIERDVTDYGNAEIIDLLLYLRPFIEEQVLNKTVISVVGIILKFSDCRLIVIPEPCVRPLPPGLSEIGILNCLVSCDILCPLVVFKEFVSL